MKLQSLTMRSELLTLSGISYLTYHDGYAVQSTPTEPDFWMGNQVILPNSNLSVSAAFAVFERHFPDASHRSIVWDVPNIDPSLIHGVREAGGKLEGFDALTLQGRLAEAVAPDGIIMRALNGPNDWAKAEALQAEVGIEEGRDPALHGPYLARRNAGRREQIRKDIGQWFGAFEGEKIVAQMGMFHDNQIARYQSVETKATHRKRGICSALLRHAAFWALGRAQDARVVIVAEADSDAGRLYRKMGFAPAETIFGIVREGY